MRFPIDVLFTVSRVAIHEINGARANLSSFRAQWILLSFWELTIKLTWDGKGSFQDCNPLILYLNFGYNTSLILHNITLTIKRGQMTALVRASGAGKSTLVDLIPDSTIQGRVLIDGVDLREFEIKSVRKSCRESRYVHFQYFFWTILLTVQKRQMKLKFGRQLD